MDTNTGKQLSDLAKEWPWRVKKAGKTMKILAQEAGVTPPTISGAISGRTDTRVSMLDKIENKLQEWGV